MDLINREHYNESIRLVKTTNLSKSEKILILSTLENGRENRRLLNEIIRGVNNVFSRQIEVAKNIRKVESVYNYVIGLLRGANLINEI